MGIRDVMKSVAAALGAMLAAAVLLLGAYLTYTLGSPGHERAQPWRIKGEELVPRLDSRGQAKGHGLEIAPPVDGDQRALASRMTHFSADAYPYLEYSISQRKPQSLYYFIWRREDDPQSMHHAPLHWTGEKPTVYQLSKNAEWHGTVTEIGIDVYARERNENVTVQSLEFLPGSPAILARSIWGEWMAFHPWRETSINYQRSTPRDSIVSPTVAAAAWSGTSLLLLLATGLVRRRPRAISLVLVVVVPWLLLDLRWQSRLLEQSRETRALFAGKTQHERQLADSDAAIYRYAQHLMNDVLPAPGVRVHLLGGANAKGEQSFALMRLRYHLLPHNVYNSGDRPRLGFVQPGTYIVVMGKVPGLKFDPVNHLLSWKGEHSTPAKKVDRHPMGSVYRALETAP